MTITTTTTPTATAEQPTPTIPISTIYQMTEDDLKMLLLTIKRRLKLVHLTNTDNINVVSVRLPLDTRHKLRQLAFARETTQSDVVRHAIDAYCKREKAR